MTRRLLLSYLAVALAVLLMLEIPLAVFYAQRERERLITEVERDASVIATIYEDALERSQQPDPAPAEQYQARTGARVVVVDRLGISVVDTDQAVPRDFSTRPEIATALTGRRASGTRLSETLGTDLLYVALPVASGGVVHGALRLTLATSDIDNRIHRFWVGLAGVAAVVLAIVALIGTVIARSMTRPIRRLNQAAAQFAGGDLTVREDATRGPPELRSLGATMTTMARQLSVLLDEQRAFVADASHQLRTPLTALRLRLENLHTRLDVADSAELDAAIDEITRLAALVADLLQLARADAPHDTVATDIARLTADRVDTWTALAEAHHVELHLLAPTDGVIALAAPGAVEQILDNVLDNALTASPTGSTISVAIHPGRASHRLTVTDEGPGLSGDDKTRALRRFWRGSTSSPGTGLGLPIAIALARASGGTLALTDADGRGLTVVVELLAVDDPLPKKGPSTVAAKGRSGAR